MAVRYLKKKGYTILQQNYRYKKAEVDIIARIGTEIVFVEVKTRKNQQFGFPEEFVDAGKINRLGLAAEEYLKDRTDVSVRFDLISILINRNYEIKHITDAFLPDRETF